MCARRFRPELKIRPFFLVGVSHYMGTVGASPGALYTKLSQIPSPVTMRLTILINGPDPTVNHDYAVLWLDTEEHRWSREAHSGVDLPEWGKLEAYGTKTVLAGSASTEPLCVLHDLWIRQHGELSGADGMATLAQLPQSKTIWHWRLQAVDRTQVRAESALFAGDESARSSTLSAQTRRISRPAPATAIGARSAV